MTGKAVLSNLITKPPKSLTFMDWSEKNQESIVCGFDFIDIPIHNMTALRQSCKKNNVTVNSVLLASLILSWTPLIIKRQDEIAKNRKPEEHVGLTFPVNIRDRVPMIEPTLMKPSMDPAILNCCAAPLDLLYSISYLKTVSENWEKEVNVGKKKEIFWEFSRKVHSAVQKELASDKMFGRSLGLDLFWRIILNDVLKSKMNYQTIEFSNLGDASHLISKQWKFDQFDVEMQAMRLLNPIPHWKQPVIGLHDKFCITFNRLSRGNRDSKICSEIYQASCQIEKIIQLIQL